MVLNDWHINPQLRFAIKDTSDDGECVDCQTYHNDLLQEEAPHAVTVQNGYWVVRRDDAVIFE